jgi:hypothetical protein
MLENAPRNPSASAWYAATIAEFLHSSDDDVLVQLAKNSPFAIELTQRSAWLEQFRILRGALADINGSLYLEYHVPRLGSRVDAVVIAESAVVPIEFKVGESKFHTADFNQAWDYGLDLKNFHAASHDAPILPVLCATAAPRADSGWRPPHVDFVYPPFRCNAQSLERAIKDGLANAIGPRIVNGHDWGRATYSPTPTIIEAARSLYAHHSVDAISTSIAERHNLKRTARAVEDIIEHSRIAGQKSIVFVTGVPGAGKTLVGLNVATLRRDDTKPTHAVFLSGNGPLVKVLREALVRDELNRTKNAERKGVVAQKVKPFIQNVHHFRDEGLRDELAAPRDHVVIFDEAQRAWNRAKTSLFMRQRKGRDDFTDSEPEYLVSYMDRHQDWAVIVCLVGGGQEIHTGEAGIAAWLDAVRERFPHWRVHLSSELNDNEYATGRALESLGGEVQIQTSQSLHLSVSMRSFRAENVSNFVKCVLDCETDRAREFLQAMADKYPISITRDLEEAKHWIKQRARGTERYGLVASSQAVRLKPHAVDVRVTVDPVHWFLNDACDPRSSWYMEDAATEFQTQGLELDWVCMTWDADLRRLNGAWSHHSFRGCQWQRVHKPDRQRYLLNAYRVLLTRARQGMVIFVPKGDAADHTRLPKFYDETYEYLTRILAGSPPTSSD